MKVAPCVEARGYLLHPQIGPDIVLQAELDDPVVRQAVKYTVGLLPE